MPAVLLMQVALLKKAKLDDRLSEFFPPSQRGIEQVNVHFKVRLPFLCMPTKALCMFRMTGWKRCQRMPLPLRSHVSRQTLVWKRILTMLPFM